MSDSRQVFIIGREGLLNDLLCKYIISQTGVSCSVVSSIPAVSDVKIKTIKPLVLQDCRNLSSDEIQGILDKFDSSAFIDFFIAFIYLSTEVEIEKIGLEYGVRGFFYEMDSAASLVKGIDVIYSGDYWVSRQKIIECLTQNSSKPIKTEKVSPVVKILTAREIEILSMIALGGGNNEIADRLCISPNTVRTHVYNIFRKIKVPSRLQASLWAAKHL